MTCSRNLKLLAGAVVLLLTVPAFAENRLATCSVGTYSLTHWNGDVILGHTLKIHKKSKTVDLMETTEDNGPEYLEVNVGLYWINPRYTAKDIVLTAGSVSVIARDSVTYYDRSNDTHIYCQIKNEAH